MLTIIFGIMTVLYATYTTQGQGVAAHRSLVATDGVLRSYAEAVKSSVRADCETGSTFTVTPPASMPADYTVTRSPSSSSCPAENTIQEITITATPDGGRERSLQIAIRTP